jgi:hypothetical protein
VLETGSDDEGTAMLEIVADMAPGAGLAFDASTGLADHVNSFQNLVNAGADVITEDLAFDDEPAFQRGIAATTGDNIAAAGVPVHSSAGNRGDSHAARVVANGTGGGPDGRTFQSTPTGCPYSPTNAVAIAPGGDTTFDVRLGAAGMAGTSFTLQWSEPRAIFPTAGQGGFTNLDLFIMDAALTRCFAVSSTAQANGVGDTIEQAATAANLTGTNAKIVVNVRGTSSAVAAPTLDLRWRRDGGAIDATTREHSIDPQVNYTGQARSVAATNTGGGLEAFSAGGPVQLLTTTQCPGGAAGPCTGVAGPAGSTTGAPHFTAADGVSVTGAGGFGSPFFGTSASAPHAAGCDALVRDSLEAPNAAPATTNGILAASAVDQPPAGVDNVTGAGWLDCLAAIPYRLAIGDATVTEGDAGTVDANFKVSLSAASAETVTVDYAVDEGTAETPADFQDASGTLTFAPGDREKTVTVKVNGDLVDELDESFSVELSNADNAPVSDETGIGTIVDDDEAKLSIDDVTVTEGNTGTVPATFTVTSSNPADRVIEVDYATADDSATQPADYDQTAGTLTFQPGEQEQSLTVPVRGDTLDELEERFFVDLSNPIVATIADGRGVGTIVDDDRNGAFSCRASASRTGDSEPVVANAPNVPCKPETASGPGASAVTSQTPADLSSAPPAAGDNGSAHAEASNVVLRLGLTEIRLPHSVADARAECPAGNGPPALSSSSRVSLLSINGGPVLSTSEPTTIPLVLATIRLNQTTVGPREIVRRAVVIDRLIGADTVIGEARAGYTGTDAHPDGHPCAV